MRVNTSTQENNQFKQIINQLIFSCEKFTQKH